MRNTYNTRYCRGKSFIFLYFFPVLEGTKKKSKKIRKSPRSITLSNVISS